MNEASLSQALLNLSPRDVLDAVAAGKQCSDNLDPYNAYLLAAVHLTGGGGPASKAATRVAASTPPPSI